MKRVVIPRMRYRNGKIILCILRIKLISFKVQMNEFLKSPEHLEELSSRVCSSYDTQSPLKTDSHYLFRWQLCLKGAQSDNCSGLKEASLVYAALKVGQKSLMPPIAFKTPKDAFWGFHHPQLGQLLCPAKYFNDFDTNSVEWVLRSILWICAHYWCHVKVFAETLRWACCCNFSRPVDLPVQKF